MESINKNEVLVFLKYSASFYFNLYEFYNALLYSNRRKYIYWIEDAKKDDIKQKRISETIKKLKNKGKVK
ncbi:MULTISPECIES: YdeI/OmpD-associated family protein [Clostridium]|uniref:YdeI/OmpD-associated family protein n=1 Tax=Clostridium TaxID=1485 RepID=UPI000F636D5C|nr:YdeI/OmpD-associated family protein [Clostridium neonatale]MBS4781215.1 YdeI/OmpD-associated family protein [Clostridium sp.]